MSYIQRGYKPAVGIGILVAVVLLARCALVVGHFAGVGTAYSTKADVERALFQDPEAARLYKTIQRTYPDEFEALEQGVLDRARAGASHAQIEDALLTDVIRAGKRHLPEMVQAPHDALDAYRRGELKVLETLRAADPRLCATYVVSGAVRSQQANVDDTALIDFRITSWEAAAAGRDQPANRVIAAPTKADWQLIGRTMVAKGLPQAEVETFFDEHALMLASPERQCESGLAFFRAIEALPGDKPDAIYAFLISRNVAPDPTPSPALFGNPG